jgi:hypothetical protein
MLTAKSTRWWMVTGATVPCCDKATAASAVIRARVHDKQHGLACALHQIDGRADGAKVVRAGSGRDDYEVGLAHHGGNILGDRRGSVDQHQVDTGGGKLGKLTFEIGKLAAHEDGSLGGAHVPPRGQATLRIGIKQRDRPGSLALGFDGQMPGQRGLPNSPFLRGKGNDLGITHLRNSLFTCAFTKLHIIAIRVNTHLRNSVTILAIIVVLTMYT